MSIGVVKTTSGPVKGLEMDGEYSGLTDFRGIPYAKPPIGELRWRAPVDMEPWEDVLVCDKYKKYAVQTGEKDPGAMSEDCLYINITTPAKSADEKLPVLVWFHGGGLTNGHVQPGNMDAYIPHNFAKRGIVVASITHRINIFGFMALPQMSAEQGGTSGYYGVQDLIKGFNWIYDNIEAFGGDRNNISTAGCSGGNSKTNLLAALPAGRNRIRRIYCSSGLRWMQMPFTTLKQAEEEGQRYLEYIGLDPDTPMDELRKLSTWEIHQEVPRDVYPSGIIYDGVNVPEPSYHELFNRYLGDVDFINVCSQGESNIFATHGQDGTFGDFRGDIAPIKDSESFHAFFRERLGDLYDKYDFGDLVKVADEDALYTAKILGSVGLAQLASNNHSRNVMVNRLFGCYMKKYHPASRVYTLLWAHTAMKHSKKNTADIDPKHIMADHGTDPRYVFENFDDTAEAEWGEVDYRLGELFGAYFANFCKNGDVNGEGLPYWPETGDGYAYMEAKDGPVLHEGLEGRLDELAREYVLREYGIDKELFTNVCVNNPLAKQK